MTSKFEEMMFENSEMKQRISLLEKENKVLKVSNKILNQANEQYLTPCFYWKRSEVQEYSLSGEEENSGEKTTEVAKKILQKVDPKIKITNFCLLIG